MRCHEADVVVMGAGPAGATAAACLARRGWRVAVVGRRPSTAVHAETLPGETLRLLTEEGLGGALARLVRPCRTSWSAWGTPRLANRDGAAAPFGPPWHVRADHLADAMLHLAEESGARRYPAPGRAGRRSGRVAVSFEAAAGAEQVVASYLLDATGRAAIGARAFGAARLSLEHQFAVTTWLPVARSSTSSLVEATERGWWLALTDTDRVYLTYFTDPDLLPRPLALDVRLCDAPHTAARVRSATGPSAPPTVRPASCSLLNHRCGRDWLAIGDAAATFDPLVGAGLGHALRGAVSGADAVHNALGGAERVLDDHAGAEARLFEEHLRVRRGHYTAERRWADRPFWRRRSHALVPETTTRNLISRCPS